MKNPRQVVLGNVQGIFGVNGWVKVYSFTDPRENILQYSPWLLHRGGEWQEVKVEEGRLQGKTVVAKLEGFADRDAAATLLNAEIAVQRDSLPPAGEDEFYWTDLEGLQVVDQDDNILGIVDHLIATGANDVLVVKGKKEILIPFVRESVIRDVDFEKGVIEVDWDAESIT